MLPKQVAIKMCKTDRDASLTSDMLSWRQPLLALGPPPSPNLTALGVVARGNRTSILLVVQFLNPSVLSHFQLMWAELENA